MSTPEIVKESKRRNYEKKQNKYYENSKKLLNAKCVVLKFKENQCRNIRKDILNIILTIILIVFHIF